MLPSNLCRRSHFIYSDVLDTVASSTCGGAFKLSQLKPKLPATSALLQDKSHGT